MKTLITTHILVSLHIFHVLLKPIDILLISKVEVSIDHPNNVLISRKT